jgi:hypothetical protein
VAVSPPEHGGCCVPASALPLPKLIVVRSRESLHARRIHAGDRFRGALGWTATGELSPEVNANLVSVPVVLSSGLFGPEVHRWYAPLLEG